MWVSRKILSGFASRECVRLLINLVALLINLVRTLRCPRIGRRGNVDLVGAAAFPRSVSEEEEPARRSTRWLVGRCTSGALSPVPAARAQATHPVLRAHVAQVNKHRAGTDFDQSFLYGVLDFGDDPHL